jgi:hypothetical protein
MRNSSAKHQLSLACIALFALGSLACGDDGKAEAGETDGTTTAESGTSADGPETSGSSMEGDGDGDPDGGDGDGEPGDGDPDGGDGDGEPGDGDPDGGDGDGEPGDGDGDPNSPCFDHETQDDCEADAACQAVNGQPLQENGPDAPCLNPVEFQGCIAMQGCDDAQTWFCTGGGGKPVLVNDGCGPNGSEECDPGVQDPPECP